MTPWGTMLQAAMRMGLGPEGFWRLSLKEWRMLTAGSGVAEPLGRVDLERMVARWPDQESGSPSPSHPVADATPLP